MGHVQRLALLFAAVLPQGYCADAGPHPGQDVQERRIGRGPKTPGRECLREGRGITIRTMLQYDLDNRPRQGANPTLVNLAALVVAIVVIGTNAWLVRVAALDRSWGALGVLIMVGPITNGVIALLTLVSSFLLRRFAGGASVAIYLCAGVLLPVAAIVVDAACILCMNLHGC